MNCFSVPSCTPRRLDKVPKIFSRCGCTPAGGIRVRQEVFSAVSRSKFRLSQADVSGHPVPARSRRGGQKRPPGQETNQSSVALRRLPLRVLQTTELLRAGEGAQFELGLVFLRSQHAHSGYLHGLFRRSADGEHIRFFVDPVIDVQPPILQQSPPSISIDPVPLGSEARQPLAALPPHHNHFKFGLNDGDSARRAASALRSFAARVLYALWKPNWAGASIRTTTSSSAIAPQTTARST